jgi:hypothetical protein
MKSQLTANADALHELLKPTANFGQELRADPEKHEASATGLQFKRYLPDNEPISPMQMGFAAMQLALRVLNALIEKRYPDPEDVAQLRQLAPDAATKPTDELACEVIQNALKHRAKGRERTSTAKH